MARTSELKLKGKAYTPGTSRSAKMKRKKIFYPEAEARMKNMRSIQRQAAGVMKQEAVDLDTQKSIK